MISDIQVAENMVEAQYKDDIQDEMELMIGRDIEGNIKTIAMFRKEKLFMPPEIRRQEAEKMMLDHVMGKWRATVYG